MRYYAMAQHFYHERGANAIPTHEDGEWLEHGKTFTDGQLKQFVEMYVQHANRQMEKLQEKGVLADGNLPRRT